MTITTAPARIESLLRGDARQIPGTVRSLNGARFAENGKEGKPILRSYRGMVCGLGDDGVEWGQAGLRACRV
ncbi:hypothetical protein Are01nite_52640 [Actinoplanes regularis]|nr:hypothetical protein Are01nite_52640 [Actinoplanes regularis]